MVKSYVLIILYSAYINCIVNNFTFYIQTGNCHDISNHKFPLQSHYIIYEARDTQFVN